MSMSWVKNDQTEGLKISQGFYLRHVLTSHFSEWPRGEKYREGRGYRKGIIDNNTQRDLISERKNKETERQCWVREKEEEMERKKLRQMQKVRKKLAFLAGTAQGDDVLVKPGLLSSTDVKDCPSQLAILLPCHPHWGSVWKMLSEDSIWWGWGHRPLS